MIPPLPVQGVVGVVSGGSETELGSLRAARRRGLGGVEVRADIWLDQHPGDSPESICRRIRELDEADIPVLFTLRTASQGGFFRGPEAERARIYRLALGAGARLIDVEWGTEAADLLSDVRSSMVLSAHLFHRMPPPEELAELGIRMAERGPRAIKLIPMAGKLSDSVDMLEWAAQPPASGPARIGFAMGEAGVISRILALTRGPSITYGAFHRPVAAGQLRVEELLEIYRAGRLDRSTRLFGVAGDRALLSFSPYLHNPAFERRGVGAVYLPLQAASFADIAAVIEPLGIEGLSVTMPFKEDAYRLASETDARSRASGASNTLVFRKEPGGRRSAAGFNTDFDGVLRPLRRRLGKLEGTRAAIIGSGGAARGAARALLEAGASPVLYYRNIEKGQVVAQELGIPGFHLDQAAGGSHRVIINATPAGSREGDPSPVSETALGSAACGSTTGSSGDAGPRIAFEMVYEPAETQFLRDAKKMGAIGIPGREMLVSQAVAQFEHFTGLEASVDEFDAYYAAGLAIRHKT